jgi:hypothetical protein
MKKYLLALLCLAAFTFNASAQLADGSIAPDFTTTDMNGNEHRLYDYLDQGYTVILDISATWCGPCWNYHSGGTFEEIWAAHGPAGEPGVNANTTDDVMILWFEGDAGTPESELVNSALGNWLEPDGAEVHFPIINDDNIADLYALPYWPIIYTICPNRTLTESGQATAANHYSNLDNCMEAYEGTNAALLNFESTIQPSGCEASASGNLSVIVQNMGTELLTSFTVEVMANGQSIVSESFNGSLNVFETTTIDFGNLTIDSETIEIMITSNDANSSDNLLTESYSFGSGETESEVTVVLLTDNYASEIYLQITDENGDVIWSEGNENVSGNYDTGQENPPADPTNPLENNQSYEWTVNLPSENCHTFFIGDYYGDGLDASQWGGTNGNWTVNDNDDAQIAQMTTADFEGSDDASFENTQAADPSSINDESNITFSVYPNPIQSDAKLSFGLTKPSKVRLDITNVLGEIVLSNAYSLQTGNNNIDINVDKMTNGIYFAHLSINGEINTVKITVSK